MAIDTLLKRCFPAVVLALIALLAYLQASGAMHLVGAAFSAGSAEGAVRSAASGAAAFARAPPRKRSAEPILARNAFDSTTGPLTALAIAKPAIPLDVRDPLSAPSCDGMRVAIITESPDPEWSAVALQAAGDPGPKLRHVGDDVAGKRIAFIGYNPRRNSPAVWITGEASMCQALLFAAQATTPPAAAVPLAAAPDPTGASDSVPPEIASKIQKVSDSEFNVDRAVVDRILENQAELMRRTRIVPEQAGGKVVGIRLFGIRPDSLLGTLGFQNGDRLESINGFNLASPEKALEAYARLRTASNLNVKLNRRGQAQSIDYRIK